MIYYETGQSVIFMVILHCLRLLSIIDVLIQCQNSMTFPLYRYIDSRQQTHNQRSLTQYFSKYCIELWNPVLWQHCCLLLSARTADLRFIRCRHNSLERDCDIWRLNSSLFFFIFFSIQPPLYRQEFNRDVRQDCGCDTGSGGPRAAAESFHLSANECLSPVFIQDATRAQPPFHPATRGRLNELHPAPT